MTTEITLFHLSGGARVHVREQTYATTATNTKETEGDEHPLARPRDLHASPEDAERKMPMDGRNTW